MDNKIKTEQDVIFGMVAKKLQCRYPDKSLSITYPSPLVIDDLDTLQEQGKLSWKASIKSGIMLTIDQVHPVKLVVYYRNVPVGYAFGGYKEHLETLEISWLEKRKDAHPDLNYQMLGLTLDSYAAYAAFLIKKGKPVKQIALVSPVEDVKPYYKKQGFKYTETYDGYTEAMIFEHKNIVV
ncbi:hypothetical protein Q4R15_11755 [Morganella morganii]